MCLSACKDEHINFDLFDKTYKVSATPTYSFNVGGLKTDKWKEWIKQNYNQIKPNPNYEANANSIISYVENELAESDIFKYVKGSTLIIGKTSNVNGNRESTLKIFGAVIENKFFSLGGSSSVKNENGEDMVFVKGRFLSPTKVKFICNKDGKKLYKVRNKWFNFINTRAYVYDENKNKIARVKLPPFSGKKFVIEGYKDEILIEGDFFSLKSTIKRNGQPIGTINRELIVVKDTFILEAEEADLPFAIALVIAIDNLIDKVTKTK